MKRVFVPFTVNKRFWNKNLLNVFLHSAYKYQLEDSDADFRYDNLALSSVCRYDKKLQMFCSQMIKTIGEILNEYHGVNESPVFWEKILYRWIREYVFSIHFKLMQLNNLQKRYPKDQYSFYSYAYKGWSEDDFLHRWNDVGVFLNERYHFYSYLRLAKEYYDFHIDEVDFLDEPVAAKPSPPVMPKNDSIAKKILRQIIHINWTKLRRFYFLHCCESKMIVGIFSVPLKPGSMEYFLMRSEGKIRALSLPQMEDAGDIDTGFRNTFVTRIMERIPVSGEEHIILNLLPGIFPRFFLEQFKKAYSNASAYLHTHPNLSVIFTETGILSNTQAKICMLLLQKRNGIILGQQHGGDYQVLKRGVQYHRELFLDDKFYFWGKGCLDYKCRKSRISYAPCYKLAQYDRLALSKKASEYILFVGTAVFSYPRSFHTELMDVQQEEYLDRKLKFFSLLDAEIRKKTVPREYYVDYGWHVTRRLEKEFPDLLFSRTSFSYNSISQVNMDLRNADFAALLAGCSLFIADHVSTTWLEALYLQKPSVIFIYRDMYEIWEKEIPYLELLKNAGFLFYSPEEAAEAVNRIAKQGITNWWMDDERQRVVQQVRDRWITEVEDIDNWWYHELTAQCKRLKGLI